MNEFKPKIMTCMKGYGGQQFVKDVTAGMIVAVIAFPLSIALAIASGLSPERGLYTAVIGGFLVSALGGSKVNIGGATAATVMTVFTIVEEFGLSGLAAATIMAGIFLILMGVLRAGMLLKYIPRTITLGFTAGIAMGIFSGQIKGFLGLEMGEMPVKVIDKFIACASVIGTVDVTALGIGLLAMAVLIILPQVFPKIPESLAAILITTPVVQLLHLDVETVRGVYGELPSHFPEFTLPSVTFDMIQALIPSAVTLAILIAIVTLLACVVTDGLMGERHNSNQELIAQGIANIFCGFFGAVPVAGAVARASSSVKNGGRTPVAGMVHSAAVLLILLLLMPLAGYIPIPALSAILIKVAYNMSNWREFAYMFKHAPKSDNAVLIGTFLSGILADLLFAVEMGVLISAVLFMRRMSAVSAVREWEYLDGDENGEPSDDPESLSLKKVPRHTMVFEIEGPIFFATVDDFMNITATKNTKVVILRMRSVPAIDITALHNMEKFLERCRKKEITLLLSHVNEYPYSVMKKAGFVDKLGEGNFCSNIDSALKIAEQLVSR
ncbi:STAS domain-containing protein [Clostridium sp. MCC353]|uniref:SulP family inorganic anion transporter n=1 Tax=Clostridium sp. MCC353 TaxID=2592646 RepID=UPI001C02852D|nr:SulP family inorganic anion transporter [Clostridium sp. MCC353]MBT9779918.1 STAS domain-containing protein [Clostridium sp. MCC353]